jgi:hypothetical protein
MEQKYFGAPSSQRLPQLLIELALQQSGVLLGPVAQEA